MKYLQTRCGCHQSTRRAMSIFLLFLFVASFVGACGSSSNRDDVSDDLSHEVQGSGGLLGGLAGLSEVWYTSLEDYVRGVDVVVHARLTDVEFAAKQVLNEDATGPGIRSLFFVYLVFEVEETLAGTLIEDEPGSSVLRVLTPLPGTGGPGGFDGAVERLKDRFPPGGADSLLLLVHSESDGDKAPAGVPSFYKTPNDAGFVVRQSLGVAALASGGAAGSLWVDASGPHPKEIEFDEAAELLRAAVDRVADEDAVRGN